VLRAGCHPVWRPRLASQPSTLVGARGLGGIGLKRTPPGCDRVRPPCGESKERRRGAMPRSSDSVSRFRSFHMWVSGVDGHPSLLGSAGPQNARQLGARCSFLATRPQAPRFRLGTTVRRQPPRFRVGRRPGTRRKRRPKSPCPGSLASDNQSIPNTRFPRGS